MRSSLPVEAGAALVVVEPVAVVVPVGCYNSTLSQ